MIVADVVREASGRSASPLELTLIIIVALLAGGSIFWMRWRNWKRRQGR